MGAQTAASYELSGGWDDEITTDVATKAYGRVIASWRLTNADAAELIGVSDRTWSRMKSGKWSGTLARDQLLRISAIVGIFKGLHIYFSDRLADEWPTLRNSAPLFAGSTPVEMMVAGGLPAILRVRDYVDALRGGV